MIIMFILCCSSKFNHWLETKKFKRHSDRRKRSKRTIHVDGMLGEIKFDGIQIYPKKSKALNLAFDVTPAKYVTALITEKGICEASEEGLKKLFKWSN